MATALDTKVKMNSIYRFLPKILLILFGCLPFQLRAGGTDVHTIKINNTDCTYSTIAKASYEVDGEVYKDIRLLSGVKILLDLAEGQTLQVILPDEAKIDSPEFFMPIESLGIYGRWIRRNVDIVYICRGKIIRRHEIVCVLPREDIDISQAELSLDRKKLGAGEEAWKQIFTAPYEPNSMVTIQIFHEYPEPAGRRGVTFPLSRLRDKGLKLSVRDQFVDELK